MEHLTRIGWPGSPRTVGVEVGAGRLRAFRAGGVGRGVEAVEVEWGTEPPVESVSVLREHFGRGNVLSIALDMSSVFVKRLDLPPLGEAERRRMIETDPGRYFPVRGEALVAGVGDGDLVVATPAEAYERTVEALGSLGSVERVEPAHAALARHVDACGHADALLVLRDPAGSSVSVASVSGGRTESLRKVGSGEEGLASVVEEMTAPGAPCFLHPWSDSVADALRARAPSCEARPVPAARGVPEGFAVARGAALGTRGDEALELVSPSLARRLSRSRRSRAATYAALLVGSVAFFGWSVDQRRARTLDLLVDRLADAQTLAEPLMGLRQASESLDAQAALLDVRSADRPDPLSVLLAITRALPRDAYLVQLSSVGAEWELQGLARDAATLVPVLEASERLEGVRFRTATTRVEVGGEPFERFTLVLGHVPAG